MNYNASAFGCMLGYNTVFNILDISCPVFIKKSLVIAVRNIDLHSGGSDGE